MTKVYINSDKLLLITKLNLSLIGKQNVDSTCLYIYDENNFISVDFPPKYINQV